MLATLRCFVQQGLPLGNSMTIQHYLDNKSVISRIKSSMELKRSWPNQQLQSKQDVISEIIIHTATVQFTCQGPIPMDQGPPRLTHPIPHAGLTCTVELRSGSSCEQFFQPQPNATGTSSSLIPDPKPIHHPKQVDHKPHQVADTRGRHNT